MKTRRPRDKDSFGFGIFPENESPPTEHIDDPSSRSSKESDESESLPGRTGEKKENEPKRSARSSFQKYIQVGKRGEPLCLAELLAMERNKGLVEPDYDETYAKLRQGGDETYLTELEKMSMQELVAEARRLSIEDAPDLSSRQELLFQILRNRVKRNGLMFGEGTLEILPDQFGFLRSSDYHYLSCPDDIYISPSQIRRFSLRPGCIVSGQIRPPKENERYFALLRVEAVNHEDPNMLNSRPAFDSLTPVYPNSRIRLHRDENDVDLRIIDRLMPVGFGQRGVVVSPSRAGKSTLIRKMAEGALANHPDLYVFVLLLEERPEEVTEIAKHLKEPRCEVVCSLFDEPPSRHIHLAEVVLEKAKRMVEYGKDVLIFLDSLTKLAQAWNTVSSPDEIPVAPSEKINLQPVKKYFSSARKAEEGGSLTLLATVSSDNENPLAKTVLESFKGTGNLEIYLDGSLAEKRIWPAIDVHKSGTRHEEFLLSDEEFQSASALRRQLVGLSLEEVIELLHRPF